MPLIEQAGNVVDNRHVDPAKLLTISAACYSSSPLAFFTSVCMFLLCRDSASPPR